MECDSIVKAYEFKDTLKSDIIEAQHDQIILDQKILGEYKYKVHNLRLASLGLGGISALLLILLLIK